ncbi:hypothetical protein KC19_7G064300 [Ceratodon purpureus]|uniref:Uncharacterized protein n=1 Tax=Ceratodon purpureus TaxID=3225 RepID=A0A8T0H575_CERPU|nr:hypothetical protein KC19_7G064300 [Ceratodon purpureus]
MWYWLEPRTWIQKIMGWGTFVVCLLFFPFAVMINLGLSFFRSIVPSKYRIVKDKVIIVTGASSGIGQCIAMEYAKKGAKLVLAARRKEKLEEVRQACLDNGARDASICPTDVSNPEACENLIKFTVDTYGRLDVLVNNAGSADICAFEEYEDTKKFRKTVEVDFWGNILTTRYALEHLRRTRGQIVVTCSIAAVVPYPKQSFYNASKAALLNFYDTLRVEPIGQSVAITIALPGFIVSELTSNGPKGHIPRWWPMMKTEDCAKKIVDAALANNRWALVPFWYSFNVLFRVFAPELLEVPPRMFLLGKPPNKGVKLMSESVLGKDNSHKAFQSLKAFAE